MSSKTSSPLTPWPDWKRRLYIVIFGTETPAGRTFDLILLISIAASVIIVFLDSVNRLHDLYGNFFYIAEWVFTILFTLEYILRITTSRKPFNYVFSFYGIIDLLAVIPTYLSLFLTGGQYLIVIRILRLLRIFRILKLNRYLGASNYLWASIINSRYKIGVFLWFILTIIIIMGAVMYLIEGPQNGFTSIPESIYWAIVTLTTVGYGDISPHTAVGKVIASFIMIIGYSIIAVPTGIISAEMSKFRIMGLKNCERCGEDSNAEDARFCKRCGEKL
jgi:voltage-gated potassium channel